MGKVIPNLLNLEAFVYWIAGKYKEYTKTFLGNNYFGNKLIKSTLSTTVEYNIIINPQIYSQ